MAKSINTIVLFALSDQSTFDDFRLILYCKTLASRKPHLSTFNLHTTHFFFKMFGFVIHLFSLKWFRTFQRSSLRNNEIWTCGQSNLKSRLFILKEKNTNSYALYLSSVGQNKPASSGLVVVFDKKFATKNYFIFIRGKHSHQLTKRINTLID